MPKHKVGTHEEWSAAREELLEREQEVGKLDEEVTKERQELPWVPVENARRVVRRAVAAPDVSPEVRADV